LHGASPRRARRPRGRRTRSCDAAAEGHPHEEWLLGTEDERVATIKLW